MIMFRKATLAGLVIAGVAASTPALTPVHEASQIKLAERDVSCLALNIYFEARNQPYIGALAVGHVVLNRVDSKRYPNTICGVVQQGRTWKGHIVRHKCQFSWHCDGKSDKPTDIASWRTARILARVILTGQIPDPTNGALWYHATYVNPYWAKTMTRVAKFGQHIFYEEK